MSLSSFDIYPKLRESFRERTVLGASISLFAIAIVTLLFLSELSFYLSTHTIDHLRVDTNAGDKIAINFDITFPRVPCALLSVDVMDVAGSQNLDVEHDVSKVPLDFKGNPLGAVIEHRVSEQSLSESLVLSGSDGGEGKGTLRRDMHQNDSNYCGSCYGAEDGDHKCCNTCRDVLEAYKLKGWVLDQPESVDQCARESSPGDDAIKRHEGCRIYGKLKVDRVAGNFHFAPGHGFQQSHMHIHDFSAFKAGLFDISHTINHLSFGDSYPGIVNPLDGQQRKITVGGGIFQYYVKVVPTTYKYLDGKVVDTNQFSVTEHVTTVKAKQGQGLPGAFFFYDLSPIRVQFEEEHKSFMHFLTQLCAIVGGVFTVVGIFDRFLHTSLRRLEKTKLGKFS